MRLFPLLLCTAAVASAACVAAPEIQKEIDRLPLLSDSSLTLEQRMAPRRTLADRYPEDYFAQSAAMPRVVPASSADWNALLARYRAMRDRDAGDLLEAQMRLSAPDPSGAELAQAVLKRQPDSPIPHLLLLRSDGQRGLASKAAEDHFREYRRLCPTSAAPFAYLHAAQDPELLKRSLDAAHGILLTRFDPEAIAAWRDIIDVMRLSGDARLRTDVLFLRSRNLYDRDDWMSVMTTAYLYTHDDKARDALLTAAAKALPESRYGVQAALEQWNAAHPATTDPAARARRQQELGEFLYGFWQSHPNSAAAVQQLAGVEAFGTLSNEQVERVIDARRKMAAERPDLSMSPAQLDLSDARVFVARKMRLAEVPGLIESALRAADEQQRSLAVRPNSPLASIGPIQARLQARQVLAESYLLQNNSEKAKAALLEMRADLDALKSAAASNSMFEQYYAAQERAYHDMAQRAGME